MFIEILGIILFGFVLSYYYNYISLSRKLDTENRYFYLKYELIYSISLKKIYILFEFQS